MFWIAIGSITFVACAAMLILAIIFVFLKNGLAKRLFLFSGIAFVVSIIALSVSPDMPEENTTAPAAVSEPVAVVETVEAGETTEKETTVEEVEEPVVEEVVEDSGTSFNGNGTFAVNNEIQPGLYRAENISYWARLAGFSGELSDVLANGIPDGPVLVEIKASDVGFQSTGFGTWELIDENYNPGAVTEFGDGIYIVGKDIDPGTYKSDGSVTYWARLSDFSGELNGTIANGIPQGPEIVEIQSSDVGFQTSGGGTWTKVE